MRLSAILVAGGLLLTSINQLAAQTSPTPPNTKMDGIMERILEEVIKLNAKVDGLNSTVAGINQKVSAIPTRRAGLSISLGAPQNCGSAECAVLAKSLCAAAGYANGVVASSQGSTIWAATCSD